MIFSSKISLGKAARHCASTWLACARASALPRVAITIESPGMSTCSLVPESRPAFARCRTNTTGAKQRLGLFSDDILASCDFLRAEHQVIVGNRLQVVDIVQIDIRHQV